MATQGYGRGPLATFGYGMWLLGPPMKWAVVKIYEVKRAFLSRVWRKEC